MRYKHLVEIETTVGVFEGYINSNSLKINNFPFENKFLEIETKKGTFSINFDYITIISIKNTYDRFSGDIIIYKFSGSAEDYDNNNVGGVVIAI